MFFNNFLPSNIGGDVVRIARYRAGRRIEDAGDDRDPRRSRARTHGTVAVAASGAFAASLLGVHVPGARWLWMASALGAVAAISVIAMPQLVGHALRPVRALNRPWLTERAQRLEDAVITLQKCAVGAGRRVRGRARRADYDCGLLFADCRRTISSFANFPGRGAHSGEPRRPDGAGLDQRVRCPRSCVRVFLSSVRASDRCRGGTLPRVDRHGHGAFVGRRVFLLEETVGRSSSPASSVGGVKPWAVVTDTSYLRDSSNVETLPLSRANCPRCNSLPGRMRSRQERQSDGAVGGRSHSRRQHHRPAAPRARRRLDAGLQQRAADAADRKRRHERRSHHLACSSKSAPTPSFQQLVHQADQIALGSNGRTAYRLPAPLGAGYTYFWRTRAADGANTGPYSAVSSFNVVPPVVIDAPVATAPSGKINDQQA